VNSSILREVENYITHLLVIEKEITNIENQKNELKIIFIRYDKVLLLKQYKYITSNIFIKYSNMSRNIIDLNSLKNII